MNLKAIITWSIRHWWLYLISCIICIALGIISILRTVPLHTVEAKLMIRETSDMKNPSSQDEIMNMMGFGGEKEIGDEISTLTSYDLMATVVQDFNLDKVYKKKGKRFWQVQYPDHDLTASFRQELYIPVHIKIKVKNGKYTIRTKINLFNKSKCTVSSLEDPIETCAGMLHLSATHTIEDGEYSIDLYPLPVAVDIQQKNIHVSKLAKDSKIIKISTTSECPAREVKTINALLDLYSQQSANDKNLLASQAQIFLDNRIEIVSKELTVAENELEAYKRENNIADLEQSAISYKASIDDYTQQESDIKEEQNTIAMMRNIILKSGDTYTMIPGSSSLSDASLVGLINEYNAHVGQRTTLLQTATDSNPLVKKETLILEDYRQNISEAIEQTSINIAMRLAYVQEQKANYTARLAALPEQERIYREMLRNKNAKEGQFNYLMQRNEENALVLASTSIPAKIIDHAQVDPNVIGISIKRTGVVSLFFGFAIPLAIFFFIYLKKEWWDKENAEPIKSKTENQEDE